MPVNIPTMPNVAELLSEYPALSQEVLSSIALPAHPIGYLPQKLEIFFGDICVVTQFYNEAEQKFQTTHEVTRFPATYRPAVIAIYGDDELVLVQVRKKFQYFVLLNRLPESFIQSQWVNYGK